MKRNSKGLSIGVLMLLCLTTLAMPTLSTRVNRALAQTSNPIVLENQNAGTSAWQLFSPGFTVADDATGQIAGYASTTSVNKGGQIAFHVSVNPVQTFKIDFYRMGWYNGLGGRLMQSVGPFSGITQPACPLDANTGLVECQWSKAYTLHRASQLDHWCVCGYADQPEQSSVSVHVCCA